MFTNMLRDTHFAITCIFFLLATGASCQSTAPQGRTSTIQRQHIPFGRKHQSLIQKSRLGTKPKSKKASRIQGNSKYIWYTSDPFPAQLRDRVIGNLSFQATPPKNSTVKTKKNDHYYYFLSDLTKEEVKRYSTSISENSPLTLSWNHRERISKPSPYSNTLQAISSQRAGNTTTDTPFSSVAFNVNMYIIDSGVDIYHPEFVDNEPTALNFSDDDDEFDYIGHGTHVASLALGEKYGIARYANLISLKITDNRGQSNIQKLMDAIHYVMFDAHERNMRAGGTIVPSIINLSMNFDPNSNNTALVDILERAAQQEGIYVVTSAGNYNSDACLDGIARSPHVITVAATDSMDRRAYFSNFGPCVTLYAPGVELVAEAPQNRLYVGPVPKTGTSMAAPVAAGVLAVYLSSFGYEAGYQMFQDQLVQGIVKNNPPGTPNKFVYLNRSLFDA